jgi:hypothetical protein
VAGTDFEIFYTARDNYDTNVDRNGEAFQISQLSSDVGDSNGSAAFLSAVY